MFFNMFAIEHNKLFKRSLPWILLAVIGGAMLLLNLIQYVVVQGNLGNPVEVAEMEQALLWPVGLTNGLNAAGGASLGGFLIIILVAATTAQEYTWNTLQQWLSRGVSRSLLLAAKFAALLLPALLLVITPVLVAGAITALFSLSFRGEIAVHEVDWGRLALDVLATAYTLLPYAALTFLLAIATRSTVAAVGVGLAYSLLVETLLVQMTGLLSPSTAQLALYLPGGLGRSLLDRGGAITLNYGDGASATSTLLDPIVAVAGIALYTLLFLALAIWIFRRQDLGH